MLFHIGPVIKAILTLGLCLQGNVISIAIADLSVIFLLISLILYIFQCSVGNAIQTLKSKDSLKIISVRGTAFEAAALEGGNAASENGKYSGLFKVCKMYVKF